MKCFYHTDNDGKCAGAIVKKKYPECEMFGIDYKDRFPLEDIKQNEEIYIVDYSIQPDEMEKLLAMTLNVHWIDHHKTAIEKYNGFKEEIKGIRDVSDSGCELTWDYIFSAENIPDTVLLIGDRDTWKFKYGDKTRHFHLGISSLDLSPESIIWNSLLIDNYDISGILDNGMAIQDSIKRRNKDFFDKWAYDLEFERYNCIAMNKGTCGSEAFGDESDNHDMAVSYIFDGNKWTVTMYSQKVDVSIIAKKYGGGGHTGAAGFVVDKLPF